MIILLCLSEWIGVDKTENLHTHEELKALQALPLERKILVSQTRITEWYLRHEGQVYVSFSGGKDSTVLLHMVRTIFPDVPAVFVDTGLEYPEIKEFVKSFDNVTILRPEKSFRQVIREYGYPVISKVVAKNVYYARHSGEDNVHYKKLFGLYEYKGEKSRFCTEKYAYLYGAPFGISSRCCDVMKKFPAHKYDRETGRKPFIGMMASESVQRRSAWIKTGCNVFDSDHPQSKPMSFWTEQDVLEYLKLYNLPYASVYGEILQDESGRYYTTGMHRTGCMFCMFGVHLEKEPNRFQRMKQTHPQIWEYCLKPMEEGGLGIAEVLDYIGVPYDTDDDQQIQMDILDLSE